jgi:hypothetical protein
MTRLRHRRSLAASPALSAIRLAPGSRPGVGLDAAGATGSLVGTGTFSPLTAGLIGALGLAAWVLTWGRPLLRKVAFDIVAVDRPMATAAQLVLAAVGFGFFTSVNQALIGAMTGAAAARGRRTVHASALYGRAARLAHRPCRRHRPQLRHRLARGCHRWHPHPPGRRLPASPAAEEGRCAAGRSRARQIPPQWV